MIRHPLRFVLGLYPVTGWITGIEFFTHYPAYYISFTFTIFLTWILYENVSEYVEFGGVREIIIINIIGVLGLLSVFYLAYTDFPMRLNPLQILPILYLIFYVIYGTYINIEE